jgi:superfamily I DNA and/or RNA helicase
MRRGPDEFIASGISAIAAMTRQPEPALSVSLGCMLGLQETAFDGRRAAAPAHFDASQARAFAAAVQETNPLVFVQGPPGTGKTCVLEQVVRELCSRGRRLLITAPSNTAVDNLCRRLSGLPLLRTGYSREAVALDVAEAFWHDDAAVRERLAQRREATGSLILAGTPIGLLRCEQARRECQEQGSFDTLIFDEAGMARADEMMLCVSLASRAVCFGDPMQLPPHPLEPALLTELAERTGARLPSHWRLVTHSGLQWLTENRGFPLLLLNQSYRCQNPRLLRFASTLFYDARVRANDQAEYFALPFAERRRRFPPSTLRLYRTSALPARLKSERLVLEGKRPGLENPLEAALAVDLVLDCLKRYPAGEITVISPYRRQVRLIRGALTLELVRTVLGDATPDEVQWQAFLRSRISTVDSFQGGESDVVIITYVRSNAGTGIGFVSDPNRVNVTHTRARREMLVIADADCLLQQCQGAIFSRMVRAFERDGEVVTVTAAMAARLPALPEETTAVNGRYATGDQDVAAAANEG